MAILKIRDANGQIVEITSIRGAKGDQGIQGLKGDKGETGANGLTPFINNNGNWQIGETDTGIKAEGVNGTNGDSAYDIAKKNGFDGTEEEWLASLKGAQGQQGIQGEKGDDGVTPSVSFRYDEATGALYYEISDTEVLDEAVF